MSGFNHFRELYWTTKFGNILRLPRLPAKITMMWAAGKISFILSSTMKLFILHQNLYMSSYSCFLFHLLNLLLDGVKSKKRQSRSGLIARNSQERFWTRKWINNILDIEKWNGFYCYGFSDSIRSNLEMSYPTS